MTRRSSEPGGAGSVDSVMKHAASAPESLGRSHHLESFQGDLLNRIEDEANDESVRVFVVRGAPMSGQRDSSARIGNSSPWLPDSPLPLSDRTHPAILQTWRFRTTQVRAEESFSPAGAIKDTATYASAVAYKRSYTIDPRISARMAYWDITAGIALIFTAIVTPYEV